MIRYKGLERRKNDRIPLAAYCPAKIGHGGQEIDCIMVDVSESGAGFTLGECAPVFTLEGNDIFSCSVKTPLGESLFHARVAWGAHTGGNFTWGAEFTKKSEEEKDPLNSFITSSF